MYIPPSHAETRPEVLFDYIEAHPFGALITNDPATGFFATHLPLVLKRDQGAHGSLEGHIALANPHHKHAGADLDRSLDAFVIFSGPDAYITPSWYPSTAEHGRTVSTWNYIAVHVYGKLRFIRDPEFLRRHVEELVVIHEGPRAEPWTMAHAPADFISQMLKATIGFELTIERMEGKWKMSQNRSGAEIDGVIRGLGASGSATDRAVAEIVAARRPPDK